MSAPLKKITIDITREVDGRFIASAVASSDDGVLMTTDVYGSSDVDAAARAVGSLAIGIASIRFFPSLEKK